MYEQIKNFKLFFLLHFLTSILPISSLFTDKVDLKLQTFSIAPTSVLYFFFELGLEMDISAFETIYCKTITKTLHTTKRPPRVFTYVSITIYIIKKVAK